MQTNHTLVAEFVSLITPKLQWSISCASVIDSVLLFLRCSLRMTSATHTSRRSPCPWRAEIIMTHSHTRGVHIRVCVCVYIYIYIYTYIYMTTLTKGQMVFVWIWADIIMTHSHTRGLHVRVCVCVCVLCVCVWQHWLKRTGSLFEYELTSSWCTHTRGVYTSMYVWL